MSTAIFVVVLFSAFTNTNTAVGVVHQSWAPDRLLPRVISQGESAGLSLYIHCGFSLEKT